MRGRGTSIPRDQTRVTGQGDGDGQTSVHADASAGIRVDESEEGKLLRPVTSTQESLCKRSPFIFQDMVSTLMVALRSSIAKNAASLYVIEFANYVLPLITMPYLVRTLGPERYGLVAFGQGVIAYFTIFVDYGFTLSGTRKISVRHNDSTAISQIAFNIWVAKALLCTTGFALLLVLVSAVSKLQEVRMLLFILYGTVIGNVLFPVWLFQGMEKMVFISIINLGMSLFVLTGIFTMVRQPEDYLLYVGIIGVGSIIAGAVGAGVALFLFRLRPVFPSWSSIWKTLAEGWMIFLSTSSVSLYTAGNAFVLGLLADYRAVGYYSAAEKLVRAIRRSLFPISQAAFPRFSKMASESKVFTLQWARRMLILMGGLAFVLSVALFIGAPAIVTIVLGPGYEPSIPVIRVLAALPLLISVSNVLGVQIMLPFGKDRAFTSIVLCAGFINIALAALLVPVWQESGMATAVLISELFVTIAMVAYLQISQLNPLGR